ncbi:MAG: hypothetical protein ACPG7X_06135 [Flavobacteriaceae bacterium]
MPRPKGSPNKVTAELKKQLQSLIDDVVSSIDISSMSLEQRLKLLQLSLQYVIPKLKSIDTSEGLEEDQPLFIEINDN